MSVKTDANLPAPGSVAVVVQRWHPGVAGGSEHLAYQFASLIAERYPVELLTTTAMDAGTWANELEPGASPLEGFILRRFRVARTRDPYWHKLHDLLVRYHHAVQSEPRSDEPELYFGGGVPSVRHPWNTALQEEWLRRQGPHSPELIRWLSEQGGRYRAVFFVTYLYSPAYYGSLAVGSERSLLVSTLHDEPPAYLPIFARMASRVRGLIWLTEAERDLTRKLWGERPGAIIPAFIDFEAGNPRSEKVESENAAGRPFLLYSGRIDPGKGLPVLIDFFTRYRKETGRELDLVLTGTLAMKLSRRSDVRYAGFVTTEEKARLLRSAAVFMMPSPMESLSIVTLEAMAAGTPVLVNGDNPVLREHVRKGEGRLYFDYSSFAAELTALLDDRDLRARIIPRAKSYVREQYARERVRRDLLARIEEIPAR